MIRWGVQTAEQVVYQPSGEGVSTAVLMGPDQGAVHLEVALVELGPGAVIEPVLNPFEESFFILEGEVLIGLAGESHLLRANDYGYVPVSQVHAWHNPGVGPARLLRVRSPQPRSLGDGVGGVRREDVSPPSDGRPLDPADPGHRYVGHFDTSMLPEPGPIQMRGFRSAKARNVGLWMLVDEVIGAVHHTLFVVQFAPTGDGMTLGGQHYHPFEEIYYIVEGEAVAHLETESYPVKAGDLVFAGVNSLHGFTNNGEHPVRWIEAQAPAPPPSGAFFFP